MDKATSWALAQLDKMPAIPVPVLMGLLIIAVWVYPTIRKALKSDVQPPVAVVVATDSVPVVQLNAGNIYTVMVNIQLSLENLTYQVKEMEGQLKVLHQMVRRRAKPRGKTSK